MPSIIQHTSSRCKPKPTTEANQMQLMDQNATVGGADFDESNMVEVRTTNRRCRTSRNKKAQHPSHQQSNIPVVDVNPNQPQNQTNMQSMDWITTVGVAHLDKSIMVDVRIINRNINTSLMRDYMQYLLDGLLCLCVMGSGVDFVSSEARKTKTNPRG